MQSSRFKVNELLIGVKISLDLKTFFEGNWY